MIGDLAKDVRADQGRAFDDDLNPRASLIMNGRTRYRAAVSKRAKRLELVGHYAPSDG